jgi:ferredoxin-NADP reductase
MAKVIHPVAGAIGLLTIATFWLSTVFSELFGSHALVMTVKAAIPWGFLLLIPALAIAGGSGFFLAGSAKAGLVGAKAKRMPFIAVNGVLILIPAALFLASKARVGAFDAMFYAVQAIELIAGATNLALLGLNLRDGLKLTGRLQRTESRDLKLTAREIVADGTMAFRFAKPADFKYRAGQHIALSLLDRAGSDAKRRSRTLTLASAPYENDLMIATRISDSAFKRALDALPVGSGVRMTGPYGEFTLHADAARPAVFLAGGIGITPFLAMARDAAHRKLPHRIMLFYSNRRPRDAAFLHELRHLENANPNFRLVATVTEQPDPPQGWSLEIGPINEEMLRRNVPDVSAPVYYFAGPPAMAKAMHEMLKKIGVAEKDIRCEEFYGY